MQGTSGNYITSGLFHDSLNLVNPKKFNLENIHWNLIARSLLVLRRYFKTKWRLHIKMALKWADIELSLICARKTFKELLSVSG